VNQASQIAPRPWYRPEAPQRDRAYRQWLKRFPCLACGATRLVDPAHTGPHGYGEKASDYACLPMCRSCHEEFDSGPVAFSEECSLDIPALIRFFNHLWFVKTGKRIETRAA
jgi:hypothetical protein